MVRLSVILPAFNLSKKIGANLDKVESVLKRTGLTYELIPVDDGSTDGTSEILRRWASGGDGNVRRPVILEKNVGKGGFGPAFRMEFDFAAFHRFDGGFGKFAHFRDRL